MRDSKLQGRFPDTKMACRVTVQLPLTLQLQRNSIEKTEDECIYLQSFQCYCAVTVK